MFICLPDRSFNPNAKLCIRVRECVEAAKASRGDNTFGTWQQLNKTPCTDFLRFTRMLNCLGKTSGIATVRSTISSRRRNRLKKRTMQTQTPIEQTSFTRDALGRYNCFTWQEAMESTRRAGARPFDVIVIGGGSFGSIFAQHFFNQDQTHTHRILVLDGGPFLLPEHTQNLPMIGITAPGPVSNDPGFLR